MRTLPDIPASADADTRSWTPVRPELGTPARPDRSTSVVLRGSRVTDRALATVCACTLPPVFVIDVLAEAAGAQASTSTARCVAPYADCRRIVPSDATGSTYVEDTERFAYPLEATAAAGAAVPVVQTERFVVALVVSG